MAATKEQLMNTVKQWMTIDQEMKTLQKELAQRRIHKKKLTDALVDTMKDNDIDCIDIKGGKITHTQNKIKCPLNKKHLLACLTTFFEKSNPTLAVDLSKHILDSRNVALKDNIKFK